MQAVGSLRVSSKARLLCCGCLAFPPKQPSQVKFEASFNPQVFLFLLPLCIKERK
jgi:hypothetical protein